MADKFLQTFSIIKHRNSPQSAITIWGWEAYRQDKLFVMDFPVGNRSYSGFISCLDYDNHFIYEVPAKYKGVPAYMCTCGSFAVVVGIEAYQQDQSKEGLKFACFYRNCLRNEHGDLWGKHADGST